MARMIPPYCPKTAPPGEKSVFDALASDPRGEGWYVLHSLALASHVRQVEGESDFVVIVPHKGILVIEVKSHRSIERLPDGRWKLGAQPPTNRSPFQQVNEAKHSIREYLQAEKVDLSRLPIVDAVWFTAVRARSELPKNLEWHQWQVLDSEDLKSGAVSAVDRALDLGIKHLSQKVRRFSEKNIGPDLAETAQIAYRLRPKFEVAIVAADQRRAREEQLSTFLNEQYDALDSLEVNRAILFTGPAGAGKTWLALEAARRQVELGRSGRLVCFNRLLGQHLRTSLGELPGLRAGTFHQEAIRIAGVQTPNEPSSRYWIKELPEQASDKLLSGLESEAGDFIIVDEAQDLARDAYLDLMDLLLKDGLSGSTVILFGDFERQAIYDNTDGLSRLRSRIPGMATFPLRVNCRNVPRIGTVVNKLSHLQPGYRRFRRTDDGVDPEFLVVPRGKNQTAALIRAIRELREDGFGMDEIVVLSPLRERSTAATTSDQWLRQVLERAEDRSHSRGKILYTTIQSYKGLDSAAVILTDIDESDANNFDALLYIGMTRATDRLTLLIDRETLRDAYGGP